MIIDFHVHAFPDDIAAKVIRSLADNIDHVYTPVSNGTVSELLQNMESWGIGLSVVQPVITKQAQLKPMNEWVQHICADRRLMGFGGIFPHTDDYKRDIDFVAGLGFQGLKFHAEYQNFVVDDKRMLQIYDYALGRGLILLHHAGYDPGFPPPFKSTPRQFANIVNAMRGGVIVAAHLGGQSQWDDVETYLVGTDIYLDTAMGFGRFPPEQFVRIAKNHGTDKILFASDSPWSNAKAEMERLESLSLSRADKDAILGGNAKRLLKISNQEGIG